MNTPHIVMLSSPDRRGRVRMAILLRYSNILLGRPALAPAPAPAHVAAMHETAQPRTVRIEARADGALTYLVDMPPEALPPVRGRDLVNAWDAARAAATAEAWGAPRVFRFRRPDDSFVDLALADPDASCWAGAVDRMVGLGTAAGLSLCLRLLALVDLLARARWAAKLFALRRDGAEIDPALLHAAATLPLTRDARFDEIRVRASVATARLPAPGASS